MSTERTGTVEWMGDHYAIKISLPNGKRSKRKHLPQDVTKAQAQAEAKRLTDLAWKLLGEGPAAGEGHIAETVLTYAERWTTERTRRGVKSAAKNLGQIRKWLAGGLGDRLVVDVTKADLEDFVAMLDAKVLAHETAWKTAINVWGHVAKMFADAWNAKTRELRVRNDNPAKDVRGPDRGVVKSKAGLYPSEFAALMRHAAVPIRWRQLFALAVYTYTRAGELEALEAEDVDLVHRIIHVHRAIDRGDGEVKETKTNNPRRIPIEPALAPLLELLVANPQETGRVIRMPPLEDIAARLRKYLQWAGVTRAELFANDRTRKQLTFHDLRATGITWMAVRGDDPLKIQQRAGHTEFSTTQGYIRQAEELRAGDFGEPFPPLPPELLTPPQLSSQLSSEAKTWGQLGGKIRQSRGVPSGIRMAAGELPAAPKPQRTAPKRGASCSAPPIEGLTSPRNVVLWTAGVMAAVQENPALADAWGRLREIGEALAKGDVAGARCAVGVLDELLAARPAAVGGTSRRR